MDTTSHVRSFFEKHPDLDNEENRELVYSVNLGMDSLLPRYDEPNIHRWRKFLHHWEGVEYFADRNGEIGRLAAIQHVMDDCGSIHGAIDYYNGTLDVEGRQIVGWLM